LPQLKATDILLSGLLGAGIALTAWGAAAGNAAQGIGAALVAASGGWAVISLLQLRTSCRRLANTLCKAGNAKFVEPEELAKVSPDVLGNALGESLAAARRTAVEAELDARELELRLRISEAEREHAQAIIYSISDAVVVTDPSDDVVLANESAARAFEFELDSATKTPVRKLVRDAKLLELIREMRQDGGKSGRRVVEHQLKTGDSTRTYKVTLCPVTEKTGPSQAETAGNAEQNAGVVAVMHDVTNEREIAQLKSDFVSNVSHELRTPLASIRAYVELLIDGEAQDEQTKREFYEVIQNEANRLGRLIDNILNLSKIESGLLKIDRQPQSLTPIIRDAIEVNFPQAQRKHITVHDELTKTLHHVLVDRDTLYEAVLNLLSNAVKYTPEGGEVRVETEVDSGRRKVITRVKDSGVGVPQRDLPFIFDKFFRSDSNSAMAHGTGLGLPLVKHIVENVHRGRVFVESQAGRGSCFGFELDLCNGAVGQ
jgi:two-component system phosphate regulon sensor histidine kinase PhoR